ncbi:hypothetical protein L227DRAFT_561955 [Lentinus tigrinus ALCF2SS1-6]|uniref:Uncharacterized protein n=2 Tax=Lentinus tigrinus TaxID=5365 RepID=A0A5C2SFR4_9APHY|nr:hypothetical protein L227DRAFT_561955 [Lentinus tigrinus ALCF2SS1-6]
MSAQYYSSILNSALLSHQHDPQYFDGYFEPSGNTYAEFINWDKCDGAQDPARSWPTTEEVDDPFGSLLDDLEASHPSPPAALEVQTSCLPITTVCPTLITPHIPVQPIDFYATLDLPRVGTGFDEQHATCEVGIPEDVARPCSPGCSDAITSTATTSSWFSSDGHISSSSLSPSLPSDAVLPSAAPVAPITSSSSRVARKKERPQRRPRSKGSTPNRKPAGLRPTSRKARNIQLEGTPEDISSLMVEQTKHCRVCNKHGVVRRLPDLKRHVLTHFGFRHACIGVPSGSQAPVEGALVIRGAVMEGGCGTTFSRDDAYKRHLNNPNNPCTGPKDTGDNFLTPDEVARVKSKRILL